MHLNWRVKGNFTRSRATQQRLTGQATTAIGNVITNLQVHRSFVRKNIDKLQLMVMLGDDNIGLFNQLPDTS